MESVQVEIFGHRYSIKGQEDPDYIRELASFVDSKMREVIKGLQPGDYMRLSWHHDYVTVVNSSWPERPMTELVKISKAEAEKLLVGRAASDEAKHRER